MMNPRQWHIPGWTRGANPAQMLFRLFCLMLVRVLYRRCEVRGLEHLPAHGGVLLCANHPNALLDGVILQALLPRMIHPLARSGLFRNPLMAPFLWVIRAVPVYRRQDAPAGSVHTERNEDAFRQAYSMLGAGRVLCIYPEGQSHSDVGLHALKTGAARLVLGTLQAGHPAPAMVPVGINITRLGRLRSGVLVWVAPPMAVAAQPGEPHEEAVRRVTAELERALGEVTLNLEEQTDLELMRMVERFFTLRRGRARGRRAAANDLAGRYRALQIINNAVARLRAAHPEEVARAAFHLRQFERLCERFGVRDYQLDLDYTPGRILRYLLRALLVLAVALPWGLWGILNSFVPYTLIRLIARRVTHDRYQYDTAKATLGLVFYTLFWGGQSLWVWRHWGGQAAWLYLLSLPPGALFGLFLRRERARVLENLRGFLALGNRSRLREFLQGRRRALELELARLAQKAKGL